MKEAVEIQGDRLDLLERLIDEIYVNAEIPPHRTIASLINLKTHLEFRLGKLQEEGNV